MTRLRNPLQALLLLAATLTIAGCWHRPGYARRGYYNGSYNSYDGRGRGYYQGGYNRGHVNRGYSAPWGYYAPRGGYVPPPAPAYRY